MRVMESVSYLLDYAKIDSITVEHMIDNLGLFCLCKDIDEDTFEVLVLPRYGYDMLTSEDLKLIDNRLKRYVYTEV